MVATLTQLSMLKNVALASSKVEEETFDGIKAPGHRAKGRLSRPLRLSDTDEYGMMDDAGMTAEELRDSAYSSKQIQSSSVSEKMNKLYDVVIVGAGWAGIAAALKLQKEGINKIIVLEGRDYIGGRSFSEQNVYKDYNANMGSMWLLFGKNNPLWSVAKAVGSDLDYYDYSVQMWRRDEPISDQEFQKLYNMFWYGFEYYWYAKRPLFGENDESLQNSVVEYREMIDKFAEDPEHVKMGLDVCVQEFLELEYAATVEEMSLQTGIQEGESYLGYYDDDGGDGDYLNSSGFTPVVERLAEPIKDKIVTNAKVTRIGYSGKHPRITFKDSSSGNKSTIEARKVIVTVPLGVLKKGNELITFKPPLPKWKQNAIESIGMGTSSKMFLYWKDEDVFWSQSKANMIIDGNHADNKKVQMTFYNASHSHKKDLSYLFTFMKGSDILELEEKFAFSDPEFYENSLKELAMKRLRILFGDDIKDPVKVIATKWNADEFSKGVYSFNKVGTKDSHRKKLRKSIDDKIFFGGEATSKLYYATMHGAYWSGKSVGNEVAENLRSD